MTLGYNSSETHPDEPLFRETLALASNDVYVDPQIAIDEERFTKLLVELGVRKEFADLTDMRILRGAMNAARLALQDPVEPHSFDTLLSLIPQP